jgi:hypothetical protein
MEKSTSAAKLTCASRLRQHTWRGDAETHSFLLNQLISIRQLLEEMDDILILADVSNIRIGTPLLHLIEAR